jgi:hypothetical protein
MNLLGDNVSTIKKNKQKTKTSSVVWVR